MLCFLRARQALTFVPPKARALDANLARQRPALSTQAASRAREAPTRFAQARLVVVYVNAKRELDLGEGGSALPRRGSALALRLPVGLVRRPPPTNAPSTIAAVRLRCATSTSGMGVGLWRCFLAHAAAFPFGLGAMNGIAKGRRIGLLAGRVSPLGYHL